MHSPQATGNTPLASLLLPAGIGGGSNGEGNSRKDDLLNHCVDTTAATATTPSAMATPNLCIIQVPCSIDDDLMAVRYCDGGQAICVVSSRGTILRRSLRSGRWNYVRTPGGRFPLWSLDFSPDGSLGCAVGGVGTIFVSQDAGRTWKKGGTGVRSSFICSTVLSDGKTICIVGDEGRILMSRNGGRDWEDRSSRLKLWDNWLNAADFLDNGKIGWAVGAKGLMLRTDDGGTSWAPYVLDGCPELVDVCCLETTKIWVIGQNGIVLTTQPL